MAKHKKVISEDDKVPEKKRKNPPNLWNRFYPASVDTQKAILVSNNTDGTITYHQINKTETSVLSNAKGTVLDGNFHSTYSSPDHIFQNSIVKSMFGFISSIFKKWFFEKLVSRRYFVTELQKQAPNTPTHKRCSSTHFRTPGGHTTVYTPKGTEYDSKRSITIEVEGKGTGTLVLFSPKQSKRALAEEEKTEQELHVTKRLCFNDESTDEPTIKGGQEIQVKLHARNRKQAKSQLTVMKHTAKEAMATLLEAHKDKLSLDVYTILKKTIQTSRMAEWCHAAGFSLCPISYEPQVKENLGAGFPWINTFMMILEQVASYFVKRYPNCVYITPTFYMLPKTEVIAKIKYCVTIHAEGKKVSASNELSTLMEKNRTTWPTVWDTDYTIQTIEAILADKLACGGDQTGSTIKKPKL